MSSDGESEANVHTARIAFNRRIDEFFDFGKRDDLIKSFFNLPPFHSKNRAVEINVFSAGEFGMKPCSDFQQRSDSSVYLSSAFSGLSNSRENFKKRALSRPVFSDKADNFSLFYLE